jgi:tetratricopeptide (TPR) repeat protein
MHIEKALKAIQTGDTEEAIKLLQMLISEEPENTSAKFELGKIYQGMVLHDAAIKLYKEILAIEPNHLNSALNLSVSLHHSGLRKEALDALSSIKKLHHTYLSETQIGRIYVKLGYNDLGIEHYQKALKLNPTSFEAYTNLGAAYQNIGEIEDAIHAFQQAISYNKKCAEAYQGLAFLKKLEPGSEILKDMEALHKDAEISINDNILLSYSLGRAYDNNEEYNAAFSYTHQANQLERKAFDYSQTISDQYFDSIKRIFSKEMLETHPGTGAELDTPIFIVGMPRSGTSLVEQILASHSKVFGAGELQDLPALIKITQYVTRSKFPDNIPSMPKELLVRISNQYLWQLGAHAKGEHHITDKLPHNFMNIGLIHIMFPKAKIIHCQRDPADTCFSIYQNYFSEQHHYSHSLEELGNYYRQYMKLMDHWHAVLPGKIYNSNYEKLVANPDHEIKEILNYCGLLYEEKCANFYETSRTVSTASAAQVRKPINNLSVMKWKKYQDHLKPLTKILSN